MASHASPNPLPPVFECHLIVFVASVSARSLFACMTSLYGAVPELAVLEHLPAVSSEGNHHR